jgi:hypothetical protein
VEYHPSPRSKLQNLEELLKKNGYDVSYRQNRKDLVGAKEGLILIVAKKCI